AGCVDFQAGATFGLCLFPVTRLRQRIDELRADGGDFGGYLERPAVRGDGLLSLVGCEQGYAEPLQRTGVVRSQRHGDAVVASRLRDPAVFVQRVAQLAMSPEVPGLTTTHLMQQLNAVTPGPRPPQQQTEDRQLMLRRGRRAGEHVGSEF